MAPNLNMPTSWKSLLMFTPKLTTIFTACSRIKREMYVDLDEGQSAIGDKEHGGEDQIAGVRGKNDHCEESG